MGRAPSEGAARHRLGPRTRHAARHRRRLRDGLPDRPSPGRLGAPRTAVALLHPTDPGLPFQRAALQRRSDRGDPGRDPRDPDRARLRPGRAGGGAAPDPPRLPVRPDQAGPVLAVRDPRPPGGGAPPYAGSRARSGGGDRLGRGTGAVPTRASPPPGDGALLGRGRRGSGRAGRGGSNGIGTLSPGRRRCPRLHPALLQAVEHPLRGEGHAVRAGWVVLALTAIAAGGSVLASPADLFDGERAWRADSILCEPRFEGRRSASEGGRAAEDWIAARFAEAGLRPGSREGTFFQEVPVIRTREKKAKIEILDGPFGKVRLLHGEDFNLLLTPGEGKATAEAVIVGHGIDAPEKGWSDYEGIDLDGKIAVILRGRPGEETEEQRWDREYSRNHTFPAAVRRGAVAVLYQQRSRPIAGAALGSEAYEADVPGAYVSERVVDLLLRGTGWDVEKLRARLKEGPFPLATGRRIRIEVDIDGPESATARNVLGVLRGSDPRIGDEVVLFGAHHDHIGRSAAGLLHAGANDNASGTAVVLELARALGRSEWRPKRTIYFVAFAAEEMGLLGSTRLATDPPFDTTRFAAMVNLDMAGHGDGGFGVAGGTRLGRPYFAWRTGLDSTRAALFEEYRLEGNNSDYAPFARRGVPAVTSWSRGDHEYYHDFTDVPRHVLPRNLEGVGRGLGSLIVALADHPEPLADGLGVERTLRAASFQVDLDETAADRIIDPDRSLLGAEGLICGRLVSCDGPPGETAAVLRRLGRLHALAAERPWLDVSSDLNGIEDSWDRLAVALVPVVSTVALEVAGREAIEPLGRAGIAGAVWPEGMPPPSPEILDALGREDRLLITSAGNDWTGPAERPDLAVIVRTEPEMEIPDPPEDGNARVLLALRVSGADELPRIESALERWPSERVHLDFVAGLEAGVEEARALGFLARLRENGWTEETIRALIGGNLRRL
ncbi:MAG: M20/M25/M40 family metallo-hydrolase [Candidatus Eisenbacteria bacterium]|nr:M20/M25/M40 family metallo-hydrolase [Candidatus Latescibacterota bacterium]MBD3301456.1 M20/M25/M40 family metallo-hydrolase [Candidatus Eisenbacteria bacterium]